MLTYQNTKNNLYRFFTQGNERSVKAKKNIAASFIIKGLSILISLLLVPLTLNYLNPTKYGIWITLFSIISWFSFFDIGLGNGLRNKFAEAIAKGEKEKARIYISTTYGLLTLIVSVMLIIFTIVNNFIDWTAILNAPSELKDELSSLAFIVFGFFCLRFVLQLIGTIVTADQKPALNNLFNFFSNLIALAVIYILTRTTSGSLVYLGTAMTGAPVVVFFIASIFFYKTKYREFTPNIRLVNFKYVKDLMGLGIKFFIIQLAAVILFTTDNIIIIQIFGPAEVTSYNISFKYFTIVITLFMIILSPFWSAFTDAYAKNDFIWIKNIINNSIKIWKIVLVVIIIMLLAANWIYKIWLGNIITIPFALSLIMSIYVLVSTFNAIFVVFINGTGKLRLQLYFSIASIIINIPLSILLAKTFGMGTPGVMLATIICILPMVIITPIQTNKIIKNTAYGVWNK